MRGSRRGSGAVRVVAVLGAWLLALGAAVWAQSGFDCNPGSMPEGSFVFADNSGWSASETAAALLCNYGVEGGSGNVAGFAVTVEYRCPDATAQTWQGLTGSPRNDEVSRTATQLLLRKVDPENGFTGFAGWFTMRERLFWLLDAQTIITIVLLTDPGQLDAQALTGAAASLAAAHRPSFPGCPVAGPNQPPSVRLSFSPENPTPADTISLTADASDPDGDALTYAWSVNGVRQNATGARVQWNHPATGEHTVAVTVTDPHGATAEASVSITVETTSCPAPLSGLALSRRAPVPTGSALRAAHAHGPVQPAADGCGTAPAITKVLVPERVYVDRPATLQISFSDADADLSQVLLERFDLILWVPLQQADPGAQGLKQGTFNVLIACHEVGKPVHVRITLIDKAGHRSGAVPVSFECEAFVQLTAEQKAALKIAGENWGAAGDVVAFIAIACATAPTLWTKACGIVGGLLAGGMKLNGRRLSILARDPPDPNFTAIAEPNVPPVQPIAAQPDVPPALAAATNALLDNLARASAVSQALLHALERAQGAQEAGDAFWQDKQAQAAARFSAQLAGLMAAQPQLTKAVQSAWQVAGFPDVTLSQQAVTGAQQAIAAQGLPAALVDSLRQFGADGEAIAAVRDELLGRDGRTLPGSLFSALDNPALTAALRGAQSALDELASSNGTPPSSGATMAQALDVNRSGVLDDAEIRQAIQYWILGQAVPGANRTIDDSAIRALVQLWIVGGRVDAAGARSGWAVVRRDAPTP